ncbi:MAG: TolC family protein [Spirochaetales bacterium]|nr:TolC family protein [Spirochaetales bacterium]
MNKDGIFIVLFLISGIFCFGDISDEWAGIVDSAKDSNISLQYKIMETQSAEDSLQRFWKLDQTKVTVSGSYRFTQQEQVQPGANHLPESGSVKVIVPLFTQLQMSASYSLDNSANIGISYSPFLNDLNSINSESAYQKALLALKYQEFDLKDQVEDVILSWNAVVVSKDYYEAYYNWQVTASDVLQKQYKADAIGYDEYFSGKEQLLSARQNYYNSEVELIKIQQQLLSVLGPDYDETDLHLVDNDMIQKYISLFAEPDYENKLPINQNLETLEIELKALKRQLDQTPIIEPSLNLSSDYSFNTGAINVNASITLEKNQIKLDERSQLSKKIILKEKEIALVKSSLQKQTALTMQNIEMARDEIESARLDLEKSLTNQMEIEYLATIGERSTFEISQAKLEVSAAGRRQYLALVSLYKALRDLNRLFE